MKTKYLKYFSFLAMLGIAVSITSCDNSKEPEQRWFDFGESFEIDKTNYSISFFDVIEDSRCPSDSFCNWPGEVIVKMSTLDYDALRFAELREGERYPKDPNSFEKGVAFTILEVHPYPENADPIPDEDYQVLVEISYQ